MRITKSHQTFNLPFTYFKISIIKLNNIGLIVNSQLLYPLISTFIRDAYDLKTPCPRYECWMILIKAWSLFCVKSARRNCLVFDCTYFKGKNLQHILVDDLRLRENARKCCCEILAWYVSWVDWRGNIKKDE